MLVRALSILLIVPTMLAAQPQLIQPIACTLDEDCFIQQYVDRDSSTGVLDFMCSSLSYDGHKGTDFALNSIADQTKGVNVLASASGVVRGVRDEMPDIMFGQPGAPDLKGRDCGNGVVIDHGDGWETQYCHMALGSVVVAPGDRVMAGDVLGQVGLSGRTEFPHLHLSVRHNGAEIDPFEPDGNPDCGADVNASLWSNPIPTPSGGIITIGFSDQVPEYADVKQGTAAKDQLAPNGPALVLWAYMFGSRARDKVELTILDPKGATVFQDTVDLKRNQAQLFRAGGRRTPKKGWETGEHIGIVDLLRDGASLERQTISVDLRKP